MGTFSEFVFSLYTRFFLRDVLSYIVPGMIVLGVFAGALPASVRRVLMPIIHTPWSMFLITVGGSYVVGAGLLGFCYRIKLFKYYSDSSNLPQFMAKMVQFSEVASPEQKAQRERYAVLKQLYPVNGLALTLAGLWIALDIWLPSCQVAAAGLVGLVTVWGLLAHRDKPLKHQEVFEEKVLDKHGRHS
jgi:hypothetical protein